MVGHLLNLQLHTPLSDETGEGVGGGGLGQRTGRRLRSWSLISYDLSERPRFSLAVVPMSVQSTPERVSSITSHMQGRVVTV